MDRKGEVTSAEPLRRVLPAFLFDTRQAKPLYVLKAWLLAFIPSVALSALVSSVAPGAEQPQFGPPGWMLVFLLVIFAPAVETALMIPPVMLLKRFFGPTAAVLGSALLWGILHSLAAPIWGLIVWWPFLIFSTALIVWSRRSLVTAYLIVFSTHALQNLVASSAILLGS